VCYNISEETKKTNEVNSKGTNVTLLFKWDENKNTNYRKHGVAFEEAKTVFNDPFAITIPDPDHSISEERYIDIGISINNRLLVVWYTERNNIIRIIGCRKATKNERKEYEDK